MPPPTNPSAPPIPLPRAEHLPLPLPGPLRAQLSTHLLHSTNTIPTLRKTMDARCKEAGWQQAVHDRTMQLLREGWGGTWRELEAVVVGEAMGREMEEGEREGDDDEEDEEGDAERTRRARRAKMSAIKVADIELPEKVKREGWRVLREGVETANVVIKEELTDGWVV